ncbi:hypothetical protein ACWD5V_13040 [Streptomyces sp. NPDC002523]
MTQLIPLLDAIPRIRGLRGRPRSKPKRLLADRGYDYGGAGKDVISLADTPSPRSGPDSISSTIRR